MTGLYIVLGILGFFTLLMLFPAGARVRYSEDGLLLRIVFGPFRYTLIPGKPGKKKEKKEKPPKKAAPPKKKEPPLKEKKGGKLSGLLPYLPVAKSFLEGLRLRLRVRRLVLLVSLAGKDPCDLAVNYGRATAAVGAMLPRLEAFLRIRRRDIQIFCDFTGEDTQVYADVDIVILLGRALGLILGHGWKALRVKMKQDAAAQS